MNNSDAHSVAVDGQKLFVVLPEGASDMPTVASFFQTALPGSTTLGYEDLTRAFAHASQTTQIVMVLTPIDSLAARLADGEAPDLALNAWCARTENILKVSRKARRRVAVVDMASIVADPDASLAFLSQRLKLTLAPVTTEAGTMEWEPQAPRWRVLATALLDQGAADLVDELETLLPSSNGLRRIAIADITATLDSFNADAAEADRSAREAEALREVLHEMQKEMTEAAQTVADAQETEKQQQDALAAARARLDEVQASLVTLQSDHSKTLAALEARDHDYVATAEKLKQAQSDLSESGLKLDGLQTELAQANSLRTIAIGEKDQSIAVVQAKLNDAKVQLSDKTGELEKLKAQVKALTSERALLREVMSDINQQLEDLTREQQLLLASKQGLRQETVLQRQQYGQREAVLATLISERLAEAHDAQSQLQAKLDERIDELNRVYASTSWKVTEPMRATRRRIDRS